MPVTKSAAKALRRDKRRAIVNLKIKRAYKEAVRAMRRDPSKEALQKVYTQLDRAAKRNIIHKNKASRLKSRLSKLLTKTPPSPPPKSSKKKKRTTRKQGKKRNHRKKKVKESNQR